jgi:DNA-binding beta-propeller fold protein YncE
VWVFEPSYVHIRTIGEPGREAGQLRWPMDTVIASRMEASGLVEEVFVADQGNKRIQVFDLHGNFVRTINPPTVLKSYCINYGWYCPSDVRGSFNRLQALEVDAAGQLRVLDIFEAAVSTIDPVTGALGLSFGGWGDGAGLLRLPLDVLLTPAGDALVTDSGTAELEAFAVP